MNKSTDNHDQAQVQVEAEGLRSGRKRGLDVQSESSNKRMSTGTCAESSRTKSTVSELCSGSNNVQANNPSLQNLNKLSDSGSTTTRPRLVAVEPHSKSNGSDTFWEHNLFADFHHRLKQRLEEQLERQYKHQITILQQKLQDSEKAVKHLEQDGREKDKAIEAMRLELVAEGTRAHELDLRLKQSNQRYLEEQKAITSWLQKIREGMPRQWNSIDRA